MSSTIRPRGAGAAALAAGLVAGLGAPAAAEASADGINCRWPVRTVTYGYSGDVPDLTRWAGTESAKWWTETTNVNLNLTSYDAAQIKIRLGNVPVATAAPNPCVNGVLQGAMITVGTGFASFSRLELQRWAMSHELGHAFGLRHNDASAGGNCGGSGHPYAASVMKTTMIIVGGLPCGPQFASTPDINAMNAMYPTSVPCA